MSILSRSLSVWFIASIATAQPQSTVPTGRLPSIAQPMAYRLHLVVDPAKSTFTGHTEIDAVLQDSVDSLYLHGNDLTVSAVTVTTAGGTVQARYVQVDPSGVARLDFDTAVGPGKVTLVFDHEASFQRGADGLFRAEIAGQWYAWTQLQPISARRMFASFDEPGFKTPFEITVTAPSELRVFANSAEVDATPSGVMTVHRFATTAPLPTYLVALAVGDFDVRESVVPATEVRNRPLPIRVIATKGQAARMQTAITEGPRLITAVERYLGSAYPFDKLDFVASPALGGGMENAGLITFNDLLILLETDPPVEQLRLFGYVVAHEIAHQWFGDLVTPDWWTDIWLNESFATWLGKKIGHEWRPELGLATTEFESALNAMDIDALGQGRPMRQEIGDNRQIATAFDAITYDKGAQVLSMFESYVGSERFQEGVRQHLARFRFGNATADDFFRSIATAADDPDVVPAMRSFIDQAGVPLVTVASNRETMTLEQQRYRPLGIDVTGPSPVWMIPVCVSRGERRSCTLLSSAAVTIPAIDGARAIVPNAGGAGYYRFRLNDAEWDQLIAAAPTLPGRDALAVADSLWADFAAGSGSFARVVAGAEALGGHAEHLAAANLGQHLASVASSMLTIDQLPHYRALMRRIYGPSLARLEFDPRRSRYAGTPPAIRSLREALVALVALEGRDEQVRRDLAAAADAQLAGDETALDPAFGEIALSVAVQDRGELFMRKLRDALVASDDPVFRSQASAALGAADTGTLARTALELAFSSGLQARETTLVVTALANGSAGREALETVVAERFEEFAAGLPAFARTRIVGLFGGYCAASDVAKIEALLRPKLAGLGGGELDLERAKERIGVCIALKTAKGDEIAAVLAAEN
jgi:aminopeptidase N